MTQTPGRVKIDGRLSGKKRQMGEMLPTHFDPFEPRYTQQKRRERESAPLPIREDTEDDEYFDHVDMIKVSVDREVGDRQTKQGFWKRVLEHFKTLMPRTERTIPQLNSKWTPMHESIAAFNGYFTQAVRLKDSRCNDLQVYERAQLDFEKQFRKAFAHTKAWHILKDQQKWKEQPLVSQAAESTGSTKKRKSSESSSAQTPTNETPINVEDFDLGYKASRYKAIICSMLNKSSKFPDVETMKNRIKSFDKTVYAEE
ncbi:myb-like domain, Myb/SANT-like DNA-binding domain protein [Artemisia annua]|uniref:Myb-like domain, Myb/SANT-like DNA-binding domain protein n=1 Tax=Artemisia annua TaxID=35608 RepID=A0A2U1LNP2_ARTAN|nr:myb-like domain, Myb/SANT-like DNA-binding domain protein [Artemisia annua]